MAALLPPRVDDGPSGLNMYPRVVMSELQFQDNRYPVPSTKNRKTPTSSDLSVREVVPNTGEPDSRSQQRSSTMPANSNTDNWDQPKRAETYAPTLRNSSLQTQSQQQLRYAPLVEPRRVVERYSTLEENQQLRASPEMRQAQATDMTRIPSSTQSARQSLVPFAGVGANSSSAMVIPISPNHRAYAQHPVYITPPAAPNPMNPVFSPPGPQEEVCLECALRDQDMIDVDVTSPGMWERDSDAEFEQLVQQELREQASGTVNTDHSRPRSQGGRLTEPNLRLWLSVNPREITSKQNTLEKYVRAQRKLVEAEAAARSRAMQESQQLDNRMRDAYSELRQSAYDLGATAAPVEDGRGVRIKPPRSPTDLVNSVHARSQSREITLLENGMIVEHVDVRREEKESRERKRKEERRARKSSRGSIVDGTSVISSQSLAPTDNALRPYSGYSQASSARPTSVLTVPLEKAEYNRGVSQSFSDVHSLGSGSPRRSRFFGFKNLSTGWRSTDSLAASGISGSMMDMHVALQREGNAQHIMQSHIDVNGVSRRSRLWHEQGPAEEPVVPVVEPIKKKKRGFKKIWRIVTGTTKQTDSTQTTSHTLEHDDLPLAPPPPLSYLVDRRRSDLASTTRHGSTSSLQSVGSPKLNSPGMSPSSSMFTTPASSHPHIGVEVRKSSGHSDSFDVETKTLHSDTVRAPQQRPMSAMSRDKSLPPLPHEVQAFPRNQNDIRPRTVYTTLPAGAGPANFLPPQAPFRTGEIRRQSFGGLATRPTLPPMANGGQQRPMASHYDEFGLSRHSLGRLDYAQERAQTQPTPTKRRSRFGLSSLLKRKSQDKLSMFVSEKQPFPVSRRVGSDADDEYASTSRHSAFSAGARGSVISRKPLEELVDQDTDFLAYRYPSQDHQLDLLRR